MKSFFSTISAILPFLSLLTVDARMNQVRHVDHRELIARSTPKTYLAPAPHWVAYTMSDYSTTQAFPTGSELVGYNVFIMSFWLSTSGAQYKASEFTKLSQSTRDWIVNDYHTHGISFLVSAFGYGDNPTTNGENPITVANNLAAFVKQYHLDGVDVDWEDFGSLNPDKGKAETWLAQFTTQLRKQLPAGQYIITHAPIAPWFTTNSTRYPSGAYRTVHKQVGNLIDWYNVQLYNQGSDYIICSSLLTHSLAHNFYNTSIFEIHALSGVPLNKLVIGKPAAIDQATNGFMDLNVLSGCLKQAKAMGWNAGAMLWQYPRANSTAMKIVRSQSWPV